MATVQEPRSRLKYDAFLDARLNRAGQRVCAADLATGLLGLAALTLGFGLVMLLLDRAYDLAAWARQLAFISYVIGAAVYVSRVLRRPLAQSINPYYAARQVERTLPEAKNSLVSWLDLRDRPLATSVHDALGRRAATDLERADLEEAVRDPRLGRTGSIAGVLAVALIVLLCIFRPAQFFSLLARTFAPFSATEIATRTRIAVLEPEGGDTTVPIHQSVDVRVEVEGRVPRVDEPDALRLKFRYAEDDPVWEEKRLEPADRAGEWTVRVPGPQVRNGFEYQVTGGDAVTPNYHVKVRAKALVTDFEVRYHYRPYLHFADDVRADPNLQAVRGTEVHLRAKTNRPVRDGQLRFEANADRKETVVLGKPIADRPDTIEYVLTLLTDGKYRLRFTTADGEASDETLPFDVKVMPDRPPEVNVTKPAPDKLPINGTLAAAAKATDDFGLSKGRLMISIKNNDKSPAEALPNVPYQNGASLRNKDGKEPRLIDQHEVVKLEALKDVAGAKLNLKPGMVLVYRFEAEDNCDFPKPQLGASKEYSVTLVDPQDEAQRDEERHAAEQEKKDKQDQGQQQQNNGDGKADEKPGDQNQPKDEQQQKKEQEIRDTANKLDQAIREQENQQNPPKDQGQPGDKPQDNNQQKPNEQNKPTATPDQKNNQPGDKGEPPPQPGNDPNQQKNPPSTGSKAKPDKPGDAQPDSKGGDQKNPEQGPKKPDATNQPGDQRDNKNQSKADNKNNQGKDDQQKPAKNASDTPEKKGPDKNDGKAEPKPKDGVKEDSPTDKPPTTSPNKGNADKGQEGSQRAGADQKDGPKPEKPNDAARSGDSDPNAPKKDDNKPKGANSDGNKADNKGQQTKDDQGNAKPNPNSNDPTKPDKTADAPKPHDKPGDKPKADPKTDGTSAKADPKNGDNAQKADKMNPGDKPTPGAEKPNPQDLQKMIDAFKKADPQTQKQILDKMKEMAEKADSPETKEQIEKACKECRGDGEGTSTSKAPKPGEKPGGDGQASKPADGNKTSNDKPGGAKPDANAKMQPKQGEPKPGEGPTPQPSKQGEQDKGRPDEKGNPNENNKPGDKEQQGKPSGDQSQGDQATGKRTGDVNASERSTGKTAPNEDFNRKAGDLQLEEFKKKVDRKVLDKLKMTEAEYQEFLKAYEKMLKEQKDAAKPSADDKARGSKTGGSTANNSAKKVDNTQKTGPQTDRGTRGQAPPEYRDQYKDFTAEQAREQPKK